MKDEDKTKRQLIRELIDLRTRIDELEGLDIKRKQTEHALRLSDAFNSALFEYNPIETIVVDLEGKIAGFNLAKRKSNSRLPSMGEVMYRDYASHHMIDMYSELMGCIKSGETKRFPEQKYNDKVLSITISPFFNGAIITSEDITERKRIEEALHHRVEELAALYDTVLDTIAPHDLSTLLYTIVERAARLLNAPSGGLYLCDPVQKQVRCVVSYNTPHDYTGVVLNYGEGAAGTVAMTGEALIIDDYRTWSGRAFVYEDHRPFTAVLSVPLVWQGQVIGVIHVIDNVQFRRFTEADLELLNLFASHTAIAIENARLYDSIQKELAERKQAEEALRESEERYRRITHAVTDYIYTVRVEDGRATETTHALACIAVTGYTSEDYTNNPNLWIQMVVEEDRQVVVEQARQVLAGQGAKPIEHRIIRKDGVIRWVRNTPVPYFNSQGKLLSYDGLVQDITERKQAEEALLKAKKLESIGILAGGIAHDFNNLLTSILGNISFAKMYVNPKDKIFNLLDNAERTSLRASELTNQLIVFSKGGTPVKKTASIGELLKHAVRLALSGSNVRCEFNIPNDLWAVEIDEGQMRQVVHNILLNAREAMPEGGVINLLAQNMTLSAKDGLPLKKGEYIRVSVEDHGVGIPQENLSKIFDPYFTTKEMGSQKGMGLGLAICYSVIKNHEGLITVESQIGAGTTFHLYLPVSRKEVPGEKEVVEKSLRSRGRVLVMDDEEGVREVAGETLKYMGYEVEFAEEGVEAIEQYKRAKEFKQTFNGVILDLTVPGGMGGKDAIKKLLKIDPGVKAIVTSGYSNDPIMFEFERYGFKGALAKPYKIEKFIETVSRIIGTDS